MPQVEADPEPTPSVDPSAERGLVGDIGDVRRRFDAACVRLRPELHRFCARMTGSPWDGEDVLHDVLMLGFFRFAELRDEGALRGWLFKIAHNRCIDFLRARRPVDSLDDHADVPQAEEVSVSDQHEIDDRAARTLANIVTRLPPRERACVVLKDVLGCSLEEVAEITDSTVGAVKAAVHRGRDKLDRAERVAHRAIDPRDRPLVERYLEAFNRRDWDSVRALLAEETRLEIVERTEGRLVDACYFINHERIPWQWNLRLAWVDGVEAIVRFRRPDASAPWVPHSIVRLTLEGGAVVKVRDYMHVDGLLDDSEITTDREHAPAAT